MYDHYLSICLIWTTLLPSTVFQDDKLDLQIVQGIWLGPWSKAPIGQLEFNYGLQSAQTYTLDNS